MLHNACTNSTCSHILLCACSTLLHVDECCWWGELELDPVSVLHNQLQIVAGLKVQIELEYM